MSMETQEARVLKMLQANPKGVTNYQLSRIALRYSDRIFTLRRQGYNIVTERTKLPNGRSTNTFIYYLSEDKEGRKNNR